MTRLGTCVHTFEMELVAGYDAETGQRVAVFTEPTYQCNWQGNCRPPPMDRYVAELREGDCERCPHYRPAARWP